VPLQPIHQLMLWAQRSEHDPAHQWLRQRLTALADERDDVARPVPV